MYLQDVLNYKSSNYSYQAAIDVKKFFEPTISYWANGLLNDFFLAGSAAKGVAIKGKSDFDFFVSIHYSCTNTLDVLYNSLFKELSSLGNRKGFSVRKQNVSLGIKGLRYNNTPIDVDIVPAKQQTLNSNFHSLYKSKQNTWTQTNVKAHIDYIRKSGRQNFIKLIKIWRECHRLEIPSMNLELSVLEALHGYPHDISLDRGFFRIMSYYKDSFVSARMIDPCNTNNIISDDMTYIEKNQVKQMAENAFSASDWSDIIW